MENIRLLARKLYFCVEVSIPLESLWQNESNSVLGWSAGSASCLFKYFELYNECLGSCLRREVSKRELWARFIVFLFVQLYNQKDNDFRTGTSLVDERAKPEADQGTSPPSSPRRLNQSPTLLSPARAKSIAEQLFSESCFVPVVPSYFVSWYGTGNGGQAIVKKSRWAVVHLRRKRP